MRTERGQNSSDQNSPAAERRLRARHAKPTKRKARREKFVAARAAGDQANSANTDSRANMRAASVAGQTEPSIDSTQFAGEKRGVAAGDFQDVPAARKTSATSERRFKFTPLPLLKRISPEAWAVIQPSIAIIVGIGLLIFIAATTVTVTITVAVVHHVMEVRAANQEFPSEVEQWRKTVDIACDDVGLDEKWVDVVLAMMQAESGGDIDVYSVVGCSEDIMQAGEGCAGVTAGSENVIGLGEAGLAAWGIDPSIDVSPNTAVASIYAGVIETKQSVDLFEGWLGDMDLSDTGKIGLIAQGYNYGFAGWFAYCQANGVTSWTYDDSLAYQSIHGGGTAEHGGKVINFYEAAKE